MTTVFVKDLPVNRELSSEELEEIRGGMAAEHEKLTENSSTHFLDPIFSLFNSNHPYPAGARTDDAR
jgi:hypothetical protein